MKKFIIILFAVSLLVAQYDGSQSALHQIKKNCKIIGWLNVYGTIWPIYDGKYDLGKENYWWDSSFVRHGKFWDVYADSGITGSSIEFLKAIIDSLHGNYALFTPTDSDTVYIAWQGAGESSLLYLTGWGDSKYGIVIDSNLAYGMIVRLGDSISYTGYYCNANKDTTGGMAGWTNCVGGFKFEPSQRYVNAVGFWSHFSSDEDTLYRIGFLSDGDRGFVAGDPAGNEYLQLNRYGLYDLNFGGVRKKIWNAIANTWQFPSHVTIDSTLIVNGDVIAGAVKPAVVVQEMNLTQNGAYAIASGGSYLFYGQFTGVTAGVDSFVVDSFNLQISTNTNDVYMDSVSVVPGYDIDGYDATTVLFGDGTNYGAGDNAYHNIMYTTGFTVALLSRPGIKIYSATSGAAGNTYLMWAKFYGHYK